MFYIVKLNESSLESDSFGCKQNGTSRHWAIY